MKTMFITGGSRGIGEAIVRRAAKKYNVAFCYKTNEQKANALVNELGAGVFAVKCDVADANAVKNAVNLVKKRFGKIDIAVLNAGIARQKMFCDLSNADLCDMMSANFVGAFNVAKEVLPEMTSRKSGKIIAIASVWGEVGASCEVDYSASKAAVIGMCKGLAKEYGPSGITVNVVSPGVIKTDMLAQLGDDDLQALADEIPLGRLGTADDVADAVMCFADGLDYVTGQVLAVNGGFSIR